MSKDNDKNHLACPIEGADDNTSAEAIAKAFGGTYPLGLNNKTWHSGIHFATDESIVAVADGQVVAYRFIEDEFKDLTDKKFSASFVLLQHEWLSGLGNRLTYYSLYMHLDPKPADKFLPKFLYKTGFTVNREYKGRNDKYGEADTLRGRILFKDDEESRYWDSLMLIPNGAVVEPGETFTHKKRDFMRLSYTDWLGQTYQGVIHCNDDIDEVIKENGVTRISGGSDTHMYKKGRPWEIFKDGFGLVVRDQASDSGTPVTFIPNGTAVEFDSVAAGWGKLTSPCSDKDSKKSFYIRTGERYLKREKVQEVDKSELGALQIPEAENRPQVQKGDVLGKASKHYYFQKPFIHHEIFTLDNLLKEGNLLTDPSGERFLSEKSQYTVPQERKKMPGMVSGIQLKQGDHVKVVINPDNSTFAQVEVVAIIRIVKIEWLKDDKRKKACPYLRGKKVLCSSPADLEKLNDVLNGWVEEGDTLYRPKPIKPKALRQVLLPCDKKKKPLRFWVSKSCIDEDNGRLHDSPRAIFSTNPEEYEAEKITDVTLKANDRIKLLSDEGDEYYHVNVTAMVRVVKRNLLNYRGKRKKPPVGAKADYYTPLKLAKLNKEFNDVLQKQTVIHYVGDEKPTKDGEKQRRVLVVWNKAAESEFWIPKSVVDNAKKEGDELILQSETSELYKVEPFKGEPKFTDKEEILRSPTIYSYNGTLYGVLEDGWGVDLTGLEPETPFTWPGFELMYEKNPNYNAFIDVAELTTVTPEGKGTGTAGKLRKEIDDGNGGFDLSKIKDDSNWRERLSNLIIRSPSEWNYSDEKYASHDDKLHPDPELVKKIIERASFWTELSDKEVFSGAPDNGKVGKEVFAFHPEAFARQIEEMEKYGLSGKRKDNVLALLRMIRRVAGDKWQDEETCKALATLFHNRLGNYEWHSCSEFGAVEARLPQSVYKTEKEATSEQISSMIPLVSDVIIHKQWGELPAGYVHFHPEGEKLEDQPWDLSVLETDEAKVKTLGGFKFYRYRKGNINFATELIVKEIKLVGGGDKGESLPCSPGDTVSVKENGEIKPYRYDIKKTPTWQMEFTFNIVNGTESQEEEKKTLTWKLYYYKRNEELLEEISEELSPDGNSITLTIPADTSGYMVSLVPYVGSEKKIRLNEGISVSLRRLEQVVFDGKAIQWLSENGEPVSFEDPSGKEVKSLRAFSGSPEIKPPDGQNMIGEGPIPQGEWWLKEAMLQSYNDLNSIDKAVAEYLPNSGEWPGGKERWGQYRLWLVPDKKTDVKGRSNLCILGSDLVDTGGNIHIHCPDTDYDEMEVFTKAFKERIGDKGQIKLLVNYALQSIVWGGKVSAAFKSKVIAISEELEIDPNYLMAAMAFETGETFSPSIVNKLNDKATGLIQFMPKTAKGLGTTTEKLKEMTAVEQLDYVKKYFWRYRGRCKTIEDLYMVILLPTAVGKPNDHILFREGTIAYDQNKGCDLNRDGTVTKAEAASLVRAKLERGKQFAG